MKVLIVYNSAPIPENRVKTLASWKKLATSRVIFTVDDSYKNTIFDRIANKIRLPIDPCLINKRVIDEVLDFKPDIVFLVKAARLRPKVIKKIKDLWVIEFYWRFCQRLYFCMSHQL